MTKKTPVVAVVRSGGDARSVPVEKVNSKSLRNVIQENVHPSARIVSDEATPHPRAVAGYAGHETVNHSAGQYVNECGFTTNTAEAYFALLKRGVYGMFHHVSKKHLARYCDEFSFRWSGRKVKDRERCANAIKGIEGKRATYRSIVG